MQLVGKDLAAQIPGNVSGHDARRMFGVMTDALAGAYAVLDAWDSGRQGAGVLFPLSAPIVGADAGASTAARSYLDSVNAMLTRYYPGMPASDDPLDTQRVAELKASVSTSSVAVREIDVLFSTGFLEELVDAIVEACGTIAARVAAGVAQIAGSTLGALWWLVLPAVALAIVLAVRR